MLPLRPTSWSGGARKRAVHPAACEPLLRAVTQGRVSTVRYTTPAIG